MSGHLPGVGLPTRCECEDPYHGPDGCKNYGADHGHVVASPSLCIPCLYSCGKDDE